MPVFDFNKASNGKGNGNPANALYRIEVEKLDKVIFDATMIRELLGK